MANAISRQNLPTRSVILTTTCSEAVAKGLAFPKTNITDAGDFARKLLACYPNGAPQDPKGYIAAVVAVLAEYPFEIVSTVCDPVRGVARTCRFLPTVAELTEALERDMEPFRNQWRQAHQRRQQEARDREEAERAKRADHDRPKVLKGFEDLKAQLSAASANDPGSTFQSGISRAIDGLAERVKARGES